MKVILNSCCLVQPAEPTCNGRMPLTEFDQIGGITHVPLIYFYNKPEKNLQTPNYFTTLKTSLSRVLVHFYPLAGRLAWLYEDEARMALDCNGKGVQLIEASCDDTKLDDLGDFTPTPDFDYLIPRINYKTTPIQEIPLLTAQLTKFSCGGLSLCCTISHVVTDGQGAFHFLSEWARLARGEPLGTAPFLDRKVLRAGDPPLAQPRFQHEEFAPLPLSIINGQLRTEKKTEVAMLNLSKLQVEMLKNQANNLGHNIIDRAYTRYESLVGHIWRSVCRARRLAHEQPTTMCISVDIRRRMNPPLPEKFFGNAIIDMFPTALSGELVTRPLGYAAGRIRESIDRVTSEYANSAIDYLKNIKDLSIVMDDDEQYDQKGMGSPPPNYGNPNAGAISWISLPLYGLDFGWGKEIFMTPGTHGDGDSFVLRGYDEDGSLMVALRLQSAVMEDFKQIFYQDIIQT